MRVFVSRWVLQCGLRYFENSAHWSRKLQTLGCVVLSLGPLSILCGRLSPVTSPLLCGTRTKRRKTMRYILKHRKTMRYILPEFSRSANHCLWHMQPHRRQMFSSGFNYPSQHSQETRFFAFAYFWKIESGFCKRGILCKYIFAPWIELWVGHSMLGNFIGLCASVYCGRSHFYNLHICIWGKSPYQYCILLTLFKKRGGGQTYVPKIVANS